SSDCLRISTLFLPLLLLGSKEVEPAQTAKALVERAQTELRTGQYSTALMTCDRAIRLNVDYAPAYLWQARAYEALGQSDIALRSIGQALQLDPALVEARKLRVLWSMKAGKLKEALADSDILESMGEVPSEDQLLRGRLLFESRRYEDSLRSLSVCI